MEYVRHLYLYARMKLDWNFISQAGDPLQSGRHRAHTAKGIIRKRFLGNTAHRPRLARLL